MVVGGQVTIFSGFVNHTMLKNSFHGNPHLPILASIPFATWRSKASQCGHSRW